LLVIGEQEVSMGRRRSVRQWLHGRLLLASLGLLGMMLWETDKAAKRAGRKSPAERERLESDEATRQDERDQVDQAKPPPPAGGEIPIRPTMDRAEYEEKKRAANEQAKRRRDE
jgi:hypothetical protein